MPLLEQSVCFQTLFHHDGSHSRRDSLSMKGIRQMIYRGMDRQTSRWEGGINGENWTLQPSGADIRYIASSKLTHLQSSEVLLSTFYTCWHLSCVCPQFGLWGKSLCEVNKEPCPTPADRFLSLRLSLLFPTGESFQCFHLISAALILLQHLMFHGVTDRGGLRSSAGAAYCRLSEFIDQRQHNMSKRGLVRDVSRRECPPKCRT